MFGALAPQHCNTKCGQISYQSSFCGTCHSLAEIGKPWALATGYDIAFLYSVVAALEGAQTEQRRCTAVPFHKLPVRPVSRPSRRWLVSFYLLLMNAKCQDDITDGGGRLARLGLRVLSPKQEQAQRQLLASGFDISYLTQLPDNQRRLEQTAGLGLMIYSEPTALLLGEAFAHIAHLTNRSDQAGALRHLGQALGYLIYLKDAWDDFASDRAKGCFNALLAAHDARHLPQIRIREFRRLLYGLKGLSISADDRLMLLSVLKGLDPEQKEKPSARRPLLTRFKERTNRGICEALLCCGPEVCIPACGELCGPSLGEACCTSCAVCPCDCSCLAAGASDSQAPVMSKPAPPRLSCPACSNNLTPLETQNGVELDECLVCNGVWLDKGELEQLCAATHPIPSRLLKPRSEAKLQLRPEGSRPCPRCGHFLVCSVVKGVRLDLCSDCQGLWLDQGELNRLL